MTRDKYNAFCRSLKATTHAVQWGGSHVWKVGGKVFAIGDSSLWMDEDSDGSGTPNVARGANARLASALMAW